MNRVRLFQIARTLRTGPIDYAWAQATFALLALLRRLPADRSLKIAAWLGRTFGPFSARHQLAKENLRLAFPDRDEAWIEATVRRNWEEMARFVAEYVFLDEIFDFDPNDPNVGRIEVDGVERFLELRERKGPFIFFTGHLGSFELLPVCAATFGLEITALFRPPNNRHIAKRLLAARRTSGGHLVPSKAGAAWSLASTLDRGGAVGMLVDQKFRNGVLTRFFGRECLSNPLLPKLARQFDCEVYPARSIRLPNGRYRLELQPRLDLPRGADGAIDIPASCQLLNDVVEGWVRDNPEQWMWFHDRWHVGKAARAKLAAQAARKLGP
ncbi:lipid A biosynthesis lauroyl acyltransferase [Aureimonas endophytica]|uniref:Lipid A biosynthesis lauroyl acyltransferase n=1 Tax=Aureimonas endophytica TaxID=2027858 RepID=A0A917E0Y8_9HYPH|nr:lipid A biosynthesis lauroyl acyltransferase [Aureimonas endophytica]GGD86646.1 lipid A biosynthesis lauroyl acyltransferase [Aureimonas endophytica]